MKTNKKFLIIVIAALLCGAAYFAYDYFSNRAEKVSYVNFWNAVEADDVVSAKFDGDKIFFESSAAGKQLVTDNPHSPVLQEELMKRGIEVTVLKDGTEILSLIF